MAQTQWTDYLKLLRQLTETVEQLAEVERQKAGAASRGDVAGVDECMKREQVLSLSLRGIDQKRDKMIEQLGLRGVPLRDLVEHSPEGLEVETRRVADTLRQQYEVFQAASSAARNTLEVNLRAIERAQTVQAGDSAQAEEERKQHQTDFRA